MAILGRIGNIDALRRRDDAVAALGDLIEAAPQDRALLARRSALLQQVGLPNGIE